MQTTSRMKMLKFQRCDLDVPKGSYIYTNIVDELDAHLLHQAIRQQLEVPCQNHLSACCMGGNICNKVTIDETSRCYRNNFIKDNHFR